MNESSHDYDEMSEYIRNQNDFESILSLSSDYFSGGSTARVQHNEKYMQALEREELLAHQNLDQERALQAIRNRER